MTSKRSAKSKSTAKSYSPEFYGCLLLAISIFSEFSVLFHPHAGTAGKLLARFSFHAFGQITHLFWFLLAYRGIRLVMHKENREPWRYIFVDLFLFAVTCSFASGFGQLFLKLNIAGYLGKGTHTLLMQFFGAWGSLFLSGTTVGLILLLRLGHKPREIAQLLWNRLKTDFTEWKSAVETERQLKKTLKAEKKEAITTFSESMVPAEPVTNEIFKKPIVHLASPTKSSSTADVPKAKPIASNQESLSSALPSQDNEKKPYVLPSLELLTRPEAPTHVTKEEDLLNSARHLEKTLAEFGVEGKVVEIHPGPIITRYDFTPAPGIKVQTVASLSNDIALAMKALSVRIVAPIPGKSAVGIELPNPKRVVVRLREIFESDAFAKHPSKLAVGIGKDAEGKPYVGDLASMPHLLIAGSTGAGKSVCIHSLIMSILFRATPDEVKLLMIDPKRLELPLYNDIPHLYDPNQNPDAVRVITDPKEAAKALEGMVRMMETRFKKFASVMARDITHYNEKMKAENRPLEPFIVVIIDELADLMAVAPKEVEGSIQRITQMARAVGIHVVLATQRPSVDVITGVIKANLPARLAFRVASQTDSRVILDSSGAESLLGQGDLLFLPPGAPKPTRMQCGLVTNQEVQIISDYVRSQGKPMYDRILVPITASNGASFTSSGNQEEDELREALMLILERKRVSQDLLKAHFGSSARATNVLSLLEVKGFINKPEGTNKWTIFFDRIDLYLGQLKNQVSQV